MLTLHYDEEQRKETEEKGARNKDSPTLLAIFVPGSFYNVIMSSSQRDIAGCHR